MVHVDHMAAKKKQLERRLERKASAPPEKTIIRPIGKRYQRKLASILAHDVVLPEEEVNGRELTLSALRKERGTFPFWGKGDFLCGQNVVRAETLGKTFSLYT